MSGHELDMVGHLRGPLGWHPARGRMVLGWGRDERDQLEGDCQADRWPQGYDDPHGG
jgi:hypothetical protein